MTETILEMNGISKNFSDIKCPDNVHFDLKMGEVHALMGENGAGKSTLMKILTGIYTKDSGEIILFGKKVEFKNIRQSRANGIVMMHQELNTMEHLTVAQNIFMGCEPLKNKVFIDDKKMEADAKIIFDKLGIDIDPSVKLGTLTVGKQQMVEIAKAVSSDLKILILDEPTASLDRAETEELFKLMNELRTKGIGMIYISHRMNEIERISDRITVMRDGKYIDTVDTKNVTKDEVVKMMVGRAVYGCEKEKSNVPENAPTVLEVRNLKCGNVVKDVSFNLKKGEILGFAGLVGAGRTEMARAIYGADKKDGGTVLINGKAINIKEPYEAIRHVICYLSEERRRYGLMLSKSVADNTIISSLDLFVKAGRIDEKKAKAQAAEINRQLATKATSVDQKINNLSGGNQQKVIIARWLMKNSDILIFDEPTKGIDIGAKSEIYKLIEKLARDGKSIIIISSELSEIQRLSDRVIVMSEGRITAELDISEASQEEIMKYATIA